MSVRSRVWLPILVAIILLVLLFAWGEVGVDDFSAALSRLSFSVYVQAVLVHMGIYAARSLRFRVLLPEPPAWTRVLAASSAHNLAGYVLPAKTGEASLILYLEHHAGVRRSAGLATLLISRILDLGTLAGVLALAFFLIAADPERSSPEWIQSMALVLTVGAAVFLVFGARSRSLFAFGLRVLRWIGFERFGLGQKVLRLLSSAGDAVQRAASPGRYLAALALSLVVWLGVFLFYAILARGSGLPDVSLLEATFGSGLAVATNLLPINAFAGFGTQELGWALGFEWLGVGRELALSTGLAVHLVQLFNVICFGVLGHLAMGLLAPKAKNDPDS